MVKSPPKTVKAVSNPEGMAEATTPYAFDDDAVAGEALPADPLPNGLSMSFQQRFRYALQRVPMKERPRLLGRSNNQLLRYADMDDVPLVVVVSLARVSKIPLFWIVFGDDAFQPAAGFSLVPRLDIRASAGPGAIAPSEQANDLVAFRSNWLRRLGINPRHARTLFASGDSMEPTIGDGDLLLVDESIDRVVDHGIYVVVYQGMVLVKRVQLRLDGTLVLKSDNVRYEEEVVPPTEHPDLRIAGRVRWYGRTI